LADFDTSTSTDPQERGYIEIPLGADIPSRSPSDNLYQQDVFPSAVDREHCQRTGERVEAHADAMSGLKADNGEQFAIDHAAHENLNIWYEEEEAEGRKEKAGE
jgi:hypothetical protein